MAVTGDFAALARLAVRFKQVGRVLPAISKQMGAESLKQNQASFNAQQSPEGDAWAKGRYASSPMLRKSGKLIGGMKQAGTGLAFGVRVQARYAWYHQTGAHLRDAIRGSAGKLRARTIGPGRGRSGPRRRIRPIGPQRKGRLRGFLAARPIVATIGGIPMRWVPLLERIADRHVHRALGFSL